MIYEVNFCWFSLFLINDKGFKYKVGDEKINYGFISVYCIYVLKWYIVLYKRYFYVLIDLKKCKKMKILSNFFYYDVNVGYVISILYFKINVKSLIDINLIIYKN